MIITAEMEPGMIILKAQEAGMDPQMAGMEPQMAGMEPQMAGIEMEMTGTEMKASIDPQCIGKQNPQPKTN